MSFLKTFKMTTILSAMIFVFSTTSFAKNTQTHITQLAITWVDEYAYNYVYVPGLSKDLLQEYKIMDSVGPDWRDQALELLNVKFDFYEHASYWGDRENGRCRFTEKERDQVEDSVHFEWKAIKSLKTQKTVFYFVNYSTLLTVKNKKCKLFEKQFVFLAQVSSKGAPVFFGRALSKLSQI